MSLRIRFLLALAVLAILAAVQFVGWLLGYELLVVLQPEED